ncbi:hypothetical protein C7437_1011019 [Psychrobacillus insolitus]|uniref:Uncharacterized protein n=1 Tax=Psychrobacillus insolitus TaxID=1461 RepID=A0A2W7ML56_9BACI|nr:hypothetical protein [Psychrobacillus insolitus]PZX07897.1 hypothetical protein C7437_1011019 [Psychrobacillus insolitus]
MTECVEILGVGALEQFWTWTPNEYRTIVKGQQLRNVNEREQLALQALFTAIAQNPKKKRISLKDVYNAEAERKLIKDEAVEVKVDRNLYRRALTDLKTYMGGGKSE